jgi:hypothetical protein
MNALTPTCTGIENQRPISGRWKPRGGAHEKMREHGVAVPRDMTRRAKSYVARKIEQAKRCGAKRINREAARYAR